MFKLSNIIFILLFSHTIGVSQKPSKTDSLNLSTYYTLTPDSSICVHLPDIIIMPNSYTFSKKGEKIPRRYRKGTRAYNRTVRNLKVVYPLAKKAAIKINSIEKHISSIKNEKEKKAYIKREYRALMKIYKEPMKKLKISQGRMLIVLIHRETGNTSFKHIKDFKGGFIAFFWQNLALLFGNDLKKAYNPYGEHRHLEKLIQEYEQGQL